MNTAPKKAIRKSLMAKIHIAKKQLGFNEVRYRSLLDAVTGKDSCSLMSDEELERVITAFKKQGFKTHHKRKAKTAPKQRKFPMADSDQSRKIRALWLNLYNLGALDDPSEAKLAAFAKRMTKVSALQWLDPKQADLVIKALRGWLNRIGYIHPDAHIYKICKESGQAEMICLLNAQMKILAIKNPYSFILDKAAEMKLGNFDNILAISVKDLQLISHNLAEKIRGENKS